jgi:hypothetical protein
VLIDDISCIIIEMNVAMSGSLNLSVDLTNTPEDLGSDESLPLKDVLEKPKVEGKKSSGGKAS